MGSLVKKPLPIGGAGGHVVFVTTRGIEIIANERVGSTLAFIDPNNTMSFQDVDWMIVLLERAKDARRADLAARRRKRRK